MLKQMLTAAVMGIAAMSPAFALEPTAGATAEVNGLTMYYEVHGDSGEPLVLLHGAYMSIPTNWDALIPTLAATHQVIAVEMQAHGRSSDRDTPITYEGMADDVAALLDHLGVERAALFGYSMGSGVAFQIAVRHPDKVSRLVAASASMAYDALPEGFEEMVATITPEAFADTPFEAEHLKYGKTQADFATLVEKLKQLDLQHFDWREEVARIDVPTLLIFGDADIVRMDHVAEMHAALGGVSNGDINGLPTLQLLVLPGTSHIGVFYNPANVEIMKAVVPVFLAAKLPAAPQMPS